MIPELVTILAALALMPIMAEGTRRRMSPERQAQAPGEIAHLPQGATHFSWNGPEDGPVMVCIHGLSTPSYVFAATTRSLAALGYRVLSYDLYGRGYSARARGRQDDRFFIAQLRALLQHQEITGPVEVLGFSMGAQIATIYAAEEPSVERVVLVAAAGLVPPETTGQTRLWTLPVIGDWMTLVFGGWRLRRELVEHRSLATVIPDLEDRQAAETRMRGFLPAVLSSRRHLLRRSTDRAHQHIARSGIPVLAIWGTADPVIPRQALGRLAELNPHAHHVEIKEAGHSLLQTHPSEVAAALKRFLRS